VQTRHKKWLLYTGDIGAVAIFLNVCLFHAYSNSYVLFLSLADQ